MTRFTVMRGGKEFAEVVLDDREMTVVPKNIFSNLDLLPSLFDLKKILECLGGSGYDVTVEKGPLKLKIKGR